MMPSTLHSNVCFVALSLLAACSSSAVNAPTEDGTTGGEEPLPPAYLCDDPGPLIAGDAVWGKAPIVPPSEGDPADPDEDDGGEDGGIGFIESPDGGGAAFECDLFAQDCPEGEKCMPWANDGGDHWNATRCSPIEPDAGVSGDECTADGSGVSGLDDCELGALCWDVDDMNMGTCAEMCVGDALDPICPPNTWCFSNESGGPNVCLADDLCEADGACHCMCPEGLDPDCTEEQCVPRAEVQLDDLASEPPVIDQTERTSCPSEHEPVVMYMSNDDSNSQASPILARRHIIEGVVVPKSAIRIHEFLNYFDLSGEAPETGAAKVSMEMRRTDAELGEFTLMLSAQGAHMNDETRPPMNLVFSLDTSGSMSGPPMELLEDTLTSTVGKLRAGDIVSIVTWSDDQQTILDGHVVAGPDEPELFGVIGGLATGGSTNLHAGLVKAYQLANAHKIDDGINRVILISDGGANAGITEADLIASEAADEDGEGIYLVGVGVGTTHTYKDGLMDSVTDAGKGAYVYIDTAEEAEKQFDRRFLANMAVAARNVRMRLTLPWYFGIEKFHGESFSPIPSEVEPQHLAPNDAMTFHQVVAACDPSLITKCDSVQARVDYVDPLTGEEMHDALEIAIESLVARPADRLRKADVIVGYAKSLIVIAGLMQSSQQLAAVEVANNMHDWARAAANAHDDPELFEIAGLMKTYAENLGG